MVSDLIRYGHPASAGPDQASASTRMASGRTPGSRPGPERRESYGSICPITDTVGRNMGLTIIYHDGTGVFLLIAGCSWEAAAIRRGVGKLSAHLLRMAAWLMICAFCITFAMLEMAKGSQFAPASWLLALQFALLLGGFAILLITYRAAGYSKSQQDKLAAKGKHARPADPAGQPSAAIGPADPLAFTTPMGQDTPVPWSGQ